MNRQSHPWKQLRPVRWALLTLTAGATLHAQQLPQLAVGAGSSEAGTEVTVPVTLAHGGSVSALQFEVEFPAAQLALVTVTVPPLVVHEVVVSEVPVEGVARVVVYSTMNVPLPEGTIANVEFRISSRAPDGNLALLPGAVIAGNVGGVEVKPVSLGSGQVRVGTIVAVTPVLADVSRNGQGETSFEIRGRRGARYTIQAGDNPGMWTTLATQDAAADSVRFTDTTAVAAQHRFYRVLVQ